MGLRNNCLSMPKTDVLDELSDLNDNGLCTAEEMDDAALTQVARPVCRDIWHNSCSSAIASGILTCQDDFCDEVPTSEAPCDLAGHCDKTCGYCSDGADD